MTFILPLIVWFPSNVFDPVIANSDESLPSNLLESLAYDAVPIKEPLNDPVYEPLYVSNVSNLLSIDVDICVRFVTPDSGILIIFDPSPINDPVKNEALTLPVKFIEPVFVVFVIINSSILGPPDPETAINALPSVVFNANSPNSKLLLVGFCPDNALLRSLTI